MTASDSFSPSRPMPQASRGVVATMVLALVAYCVALHALVVSGRWPVFALALIVAPWIVAIGSTLTTTSSLNKPMRAIALVVLMAIVGLVAVRFGGRLIDDVGAVLYLENLAFLLGLSALFAVSLRRGREALVTRLARVTRAARNDDMPPSVVLYTRKVTVAWAAFFAIAAALSTLLYFTQSRTAWSAFVNLLLWPSAAAMFALEYAVRRRVLRDVRHGSMMAGVHAFRQQGRPDPLEESLASRGRSS